MLHKSYFSILAFFGTKKQPKLTKKEENLQNSNCLIKFSEIWFVNASQQKKFNKKTIFYLSLFWPFLAKKTAKNEENWQNSNCLMNFFEIW